MSIYVTLFIPSSLKYCINY